MNKSNTKGKYNEKIFSLANITNTLFLVVAGVINSIGVGLFLAPSNILDGGISGTSILFGYLTIIPTGYYIFFLNLPFFIFAFKKLGKRFIFNSLVAIITYSAMMLIFNKFKPLSGNILICTIFGGLISGVGSGLVIRKGGCIDGIEIMAVLFSKKLSLTVGQTVMVYNAIMMTIGAFIFNFDNALFSILAYAVGLKAVDAVVDGLDKAKAAIIITHDAENVAKALSDKFMRGITILSGKGYYSKSDKTVLYVVVNRFEVSSLVSTISAIDKNAFISISDISEVVSAQYDKKPRKRRVKK